MNGILGKVKWRRTVRGKGLMDNQINIITQSMNYLTCSDKTYEFQSGYKKSQMSIFSNTVSCILFDKLTE